MLGEGGLGAAGKGADAQAMCPPHTREPHRHLEEGKGSHASSTTTTATANTANAATTDVTHAWHATARRQWWASFIRHLTMPLGGRRSVAQAKEVAVDVVKFLHHACPARVIYRLSHRQITLLHVGVYKSCVQIYLYTIRKVAILMIMEAIMIHDLRQITVDLLIIEGSRNNRIRFSM